MKRAIITPVDPPPAALAELKDWLGIATVQDDPSLLALLRASLEICEAFIGTMPIAVTCEETLPNRTGWQALTTVPVQAITAVATLSDSGARTALMPANFAVELAASGAGLVQLLAGALTGRIVVTFTAGLAADWNTLPESLRQGIMRLAAHHYRERESGGSGPMPPAAVAALWQPWRRLRIA